MVDREKVIKGLECCTNNGVVCFSDCPYCKEFTMADGRCITALQADALALLKEQEPVKPTWSLGKPFCGACGLRIRSGKYCSECGKPILWEGR